MAILDDLIATLPKDAPVRSVIVSARWTVVCSRRCGISATLTSDSSHEILSIPDTSRFTQKSAPELAEWAFSTDLLEASIGVAAINSMLDIDVSHTAEVNASEVISSCGQGKDVALVGRFHFIPQIRKNTRQLWVIEQQPAEEEYPAEAAVDLLPRADVIGITGTTLINHTLDSLLALCKPDARVIVIGPSTPFSPILFDHGVSVIAGTHVVDEISLLRTVRQANSLRQMQGVMLLTSIREKKFGIDRLHLLS